MRKGGSKSGREGEVNGEGKEKLWDRKENLRVRKNVG